MSFVPIYILILFGTIVVDYFAGIFIERSEGAKRKWFLIASLVTNIGILCVFKYYNFFIGNVNGIINSFGKREFSLPYLNILLPIGLSFHTFQAMSYTIEVYRGNHKAERHFGIYALYVMFYPQLVAGPIERPQNILYQFYEVKKFDSDRVIVGLKIMFWGFVKKVVIADRLSLYVNDVYSHANTVGSGNLWLAVFLFFPFQVYCDFSGYSSIALGAAKVMGFDLLENFRTPFSSLTISELWNRWHISLSTWFRDYLYQPLVISFRDYGKWAVVIGLLITFFLSGFWHGAGWNFIFYGIVQGVVIILEFLLGIKSVKLAKTLFGKIRGIITTYFLFSFSLIFFRSANLTQAVFIIKRLFWKIDFKFTPIAEFGSISLLLSFVSIACLLFFERYHAKKLLTQNNNLRTEISLSAFMVATLILFGVFHNISFIYFQF
jgi:D-alanyl-lipoteichoic acid acyltransferase DltB (MBOAT superfamily)